MKSKIIISIISILLFGCSKKKYDVKITFCDNREPIIETIESRRSINNVTNIYPYRHIPIYITNKKRYYNVCDVEILKEYSK